MDSDKRPPKVINSLFFDAIRRNEPEKMDDLIAAGFNINKSYDTFYYYPIIYAAYFDSPEAADKLLTYGPNLNVTNQLGETAIIISILENNIPFLKSLINAGANVDFKRNYDETPLILAIKENNLIAVQLLLDAGANLDIADKSHQTAFDHAITKGILKIVEALVTKSPNLIEKKNKNAHYPFVSCVFIGQVHLINVLFPKNLNLNIPQEKYQGLTLFEYLALESNQAIVSDLVKLGAIVNFSNEKTQSVFEELIDTKKHDDVIAFLKAGSNFSGKEGFTKGLSLLTNKLSNYTLFSEHYLNDVLEICAKKDYFSKMLQLLEHFKHCLTSDIIPHLFFVSSKKGTSRIVYHFIENYNDFFSQDDIDACFNIATKNHHNDVVSLFIKHYSEDISIKEKHDALFATITSGNIGLLTVLLNDNEVIQQVKDFAHRLFILIEKQMVSDYKTYQPIFNILMQIPEFAFLATQFRNQMQGQFNLLKPENIISGPANKDLYTEELKWIAKYTLRHHTKPVFSIEDNNIYTLIENQKINLSKLIELSSSEHIFFTEEDSQYFLQFIELNATELAQFQSPLPAGYVLTAYTLTIAERYSIHDYSDYGHERINDIIYKIPNNELDSSEQIRLTFLQILFLSSGLNKINPKWVKALGENKPNTLTYRGEKCITAFELNQRVSGLKHNSHGIIQKNMGFASTSIHLKIANIFEEGLSRIEFDDCYGKDIQPIALLPEEGEYLQSPNHFYFTDVRQENSVYVFKAKVVTPLYDKHRSIDQERRFKKLLDLTQSQSLLDDNPFNYQQPLKLGDMLDICQYVYCHYLSKTYTDTWFDLDWDLVTIFGVIERPNHGLPHVMRVAKLALAIAPYFKQYAFSQREMTMVLMTCLFSIVGRQSEASFLDPYVDGSGYKTYKKASATAFIEYALCNNFMNISENEIQLYATNIRKMGSPNLKTPSGILLTLAHKLDLLRCYNSFEKVQQSIITPLSQYFSDVTVLKLLDYAEKLLHATGDRVLFGKNICEYDGALFYRSSSNVKFCYDALSQIKAPEPNEPFSYDTHSKNTYKL